jgi:SPP1 family predicted phage head-tail adaptor
MEVDSVTITTRAGNFRHVIEIQEPSETRTDTGGVRNTWSTAYTVRGAIWPWKGKEIVRDDKIEMMKLHNIRIYYQSGITGKMRVKFGTRIFRIDHFSNPEERNRILDIICEELV